MSDISPPWPELCPHDRGIQTIRNLDGAPAGAWACTQCARKFAPIDVEAAADLVALQAFARELLEDWPDDAGVDGFTLQDLAVKHGLLRMETPAPAAPCSQMSCACAEYYDDEDFAAGRVECYRRTARIGATTTPSAHSTERSANV